MKFTRKLKNEKWDLFIVVAYGKILPERFNLPKIYTINIHYSLLPKYRGTSPVESAILNGDKFTGISIQKNGFQDGYWTNLNRRKSRDWK